MGNYDQFTECGVARELKELTSHEVNHVDTDAEDSEVVVDDVRDVVQLVSAEAHVVLIVSKGSWTAMEYLDRDAGPILTSNAASETV